MATRLMFKKAIASSDFPKKNTMKVMRMYAMSRNPKHSINIKANYVGNLEFSAEEFSDGLYLCKCNQNWWT